LVTREFKEVDRKIINGIHGTLFNDYDYCDNFNKKIRKIKEYYLSKNWEAVSRRIYRKFTELTEED
jgi:hypothetical protein